MSAFNIYLLLVLSNIEVTSTIIFIISLITLGGLAITYFLCMLDIDSDWDDEEREKEQHAKRMFSLLWKIFAAVAVISGVAAITIPDREDLVMIYTGSYLTNQKDLKEIPMKSAKALNTFLTNYIKTGE